MRFSSFEKFTSSSVRTAGGVCMGPVVNSLPAAVNFWTKDPMMTALSSGSTQWGDLLVPSQSASVPRIQYSAPLAPFAVAPAPVQIQLDAPFEDLPFTDRMSNPFDDLWDTSRLTCTERLQFYSWASANKWIVSDVSAESCMAAPYSVLEWADLPAGQVAEEVAAEPVEIEDKAQRRAAAEARQLEIQERKAALAAEGKPVNRAERRAAEKAAKEAASAAATVAV